MFETTFNNFDLPKFESAKWARNGHIQTILGSYLPGPTVGDETCKVEFALTDGDLITGRYLPGSYDVSVVLFHGLAGDIQSGYMGRIGRKLNEDGFHVYLMNHRGAGEGLLKAKKSYNCATYPDASNVIDYVRSEHPNHFVIAVGFSLGGAVVANLVSQGKHLSQPDAAITVNAPMKLKNIALHLQQGFNRLYDFKFIYDLKKQIEKKHGNEKDAYLPKLWSTLYELDDNYTAVRAGYENADHYYNEASPFSHLSEVRTPTLMITSKDDPIVLAKDYQNLPLSSSVNLHLISGGGHLGYLQHSPIGADFRWMDGAVSTAVKHIRPN